MQRRNIVDLCNIQMCNLYYDAVAAGLLFVFQFENFGQNLLAMGKFS